MVNLNNYRQIIRDLIHTYSKYSPSRGDVQIEVIFDENNDHYELIYSGWNGPYRIHGCILHIDIRNEKVWIQYDGTEEGIAEELVKSGIPRDHIVLAFKTSGNPAIYKFCNGLKDYGRKKMKTLEQIRSDVSI